jgi:DNA primase
MRNSKELFEELDLEFWLDRESIPFKLSRGVNGMQINPRSCPSCGDTRHRIYLNAETGRGNCFVCNETFSKSKYVSKSLGEPAWGEVLRQVEETLKEQGWRPKRLQSVAVEDGPIMLPTSFALPTPDGQNLVYLDKRGVDVDLARYFHLRFCEAGWWNYTREDGSRGGQRFDMRVIVPVYDLDGTLKTFQGRDITGTAGDQKYLFPKMLPGTGHFLFNGQNAVRAKRVLIGEGAFDVIAQKRALDEDVALRDVVPVGTFGKHMSYGSLDGDDQLGRFLDLMRHGLQQVTIMWDGEKKALAAALKSARLLRGIGLEVRIALLPQGKDPNEVLPEVVRAAFYSAQTYMPRLDITWSVKSPYA